MTLRYDLEVVVHRIVLLLVAAALAGCASSRPSLVRLDPGTRSPTTAERVEVLGASPDRPHRVIARWSGNARGTDARQEQKLQRQAVHEAARLGAGAVVLRVGREVDAQLQAAESGVAVASPVRRSTRMVADVVVWEQRWPPGGAAGPRSGPCRVGGAPAAWGRPSRPPPGPEPP
jgi:hypothetical protein